MDEQVVRGAVDELLGFNGWAAAACSSLTRPFGVQKGEDDWTDLARPGALYYFALVVHGADHFLIDQLAVIVQLSKRLGPNSIFVSLVDYASNDSTPFICDIAEAVMILLGISFRIRQVPPMTADPTASYYPLEEAYTRNLALEPLNELWDRRKVKFSRVIWLKGFTCPNDILETIRVSEVNEASMVCSMDWKEHNGFFIYNDRWRTRDMDGNLFRGSKSTSPIDEAPPRDAYGGARYTLHLPFQVFCCESGAHIVDPHKSYYHGVTYQSSVAGVFNTSSASDGKTPRWSEGPCMDSSQLHFCRDMWMVAFREGVKEEAKRLAHDERLGKARKVHPFMEELIQAMLSSYAPTSNPRIGYANSGDYLADETGAAPGGGPGMDNDASRAPAAGEEEEGEEEEDEEEYEEEGGEGDTEGGPVEVYDEDEGGKGRPIDLAVKIEDELHPEAAEEPALVVEEIKPAAEKVVEKVVEKVAPAPVADKIKPNPAAAAKAAAPAAAQAAAAAGAAAAAAGGVAGAAAAAKPNAPPGEDPFLAAPADLEPAVAPLAAKAAAADQGEWLPFVKPAAPADAAAPKPANDKNDKAVKAKAVKEKDVKKAAAKKAEDKKDAAAPKLKKRGWFGFGSEEAPTAAPVVEQEKEVDPTLHRHEKRRPRSLPNQDFDYAVAKILVNPRCVTTYAGVSHTQLALDLFGTGEEKESSLSHATKYQLDEWRTPPESFVCQEMRTTGGEYIRVEVLSPS